MSRQPVLVTVVQPEPRWTLLVQSVLTVLLRAWLIMLALPVATGDAFAPGFAASLAIALILGGVGSSNHELYTLSHSAWKRGRR